MLKIFSNSICTIVSVHFTPIITRKQGKKMEGAHTVIRAYTAGSVPGAMEGGRERERGRERWGVGWS